MRSLAFVLLVCSICPFVASTPACAQATPPVPQAAPPGTPQPTSRPTSAPSPFAAKRPGGPTASRPAPQPAAKPTSRPAPPATGRLATRPAARTPAPATGPTTSAASKPAASAPASRPVPRPGVEFTARTLGGRNIDLPGDYGGKLVLVTAWAMWCPHCKAEIPNWRKVYEEFHGKGFEIIGLMGDKARGTEADKLREFLTKNEITWDQVYDTAVEVSKRYGARSIPSLYLVDADSMMVVADARSLRGDALAKTIEEQLAQKRARDAAHPPKPRAPRPRPTSQPASQPVTRPAP